MLFQPQCALRGERQATPDHDRENHESRYFGRPHCVSADFRRFSSKGEAAAKTAKELVGTWTLVCITLEEDGKKTDFYGPNSQGKETFDARATHIRSEDAMADVDRILIVGGGIAGLSLATALRRQGYTPHLVERSTVWPAVGAGINLPANGVRVLRALGVGEVVDRTAAVLRCWGFYDQRGNSSARPISKTSGAMQAPAQVCSSKSN
jgi:hypothetical protein